ncbi:MAG: LLM class flavin-dependent oxidoreductase [Acidimicrobiales bacterium]
MTKEIELGVFIPVGNGGWIISTTSPQLPASYEYNREVTVLAENLGFDFALSMAKWRGFGGPSHHWDVTLESFTTMTGLAEATSRIKLWCTIHTMVWHPAVVAKMIATFDQVSQGRAGVNLVAGSNPVDQGQMGLWRDLDHEGRYGLAQEWVTVAKRLWTEDRVTHHGRFFDLEDCMSNPKPAALPPILCAATSDRGFRFTIEHCDVCFMGSTGPDEMISVARRARVVSAELGKPTRTFGLFSIIPGETDADARRRVELYNEGVDVTALANRSREYGQDVPQNTTAKRMIDGGKSGLAVPRSALVGSPATIAEGLARVVHEGDLDGVVVIVPDFIDDLRVVGQEVTRELGARDVATAAALQQA